MACSPGDLTARLGRAQYGHAQGFHVSSILKGGARETYQHDYGVPNTGTLKATKDVGKQGYTLCA